VAGDIHDPVALPVGSAATYTAACAVSAGASGRIQTLARIDAPVGLFDPDPSDDAAADADDLQGLLIDDVSIAEGDSGASTATFTVRLAASLSSAPPRSKAATTCRPRAPSCSRRGRRRRR
jgi:hypothetical protein